MLDAQTTVARRREGAIDCLVGFTLIGRGLRDTSRQASHRSDSQIARRAAKAATSKAETTQIIQTMRTRVAPVASVS